MKNNIIKKYEDLNKECKKYPRINLGSLYQGYSMKIKPLEEGYAKDGFIEVFCLSSKEKENQKVKSRKR